MRGAFAQDPSTWGNTVICRCFLCSIDDSSTCSVHTRRILNNSLLGHVWWTPTTRLHRHRALHALSILLLHNSAWTAALGASIRQSQSRIRISYKSRSASPRLTQQASGSPREPFLRNTCAKNSGYNVGRSQRGYWRILPASGPDTRLLEGEFGVLGECRPDSERQTDLIGLACRITRTTPRCRWMVSAVYCS